jgi:hypothetical protein
MKRWHLWSAALVALILLALFAAAIRNGRKKQAQNKREVAYQSVLNSYSAALKPGLARQEVENYLRTKAVGFQQMCCIDDRSAFADLVKIGKEDAPWYCGEQNIYVAFQFAAVEPHEAFKAFDSDTLKSVTIFRWLEGCL